MSKINKTVICLIATTLLMGSSSCVSASHEPAKNTAISKNTLTKLNKIKAIKEMPHTAPVQSEKKIEQNIGSDIQQDLNSYSAYRAGAVYLKKYANDTAVNSIVLIEQDKVAKSRATLVLLQKADNNWKELLKCPAFLGMNGIDKSREGDGKTPSGDYGITMAFGISDKPEMKMEYVKLTENMYCCSDEKYYNQIIDVKELKHTCSPSSEHLIHYKPQYNYALFLDYNKEGVYGKGSAIFLHCKGAYDYTLGCISISESDILKLLKVVDSKTRICIFPYV